MTTPQAAQALAEATENLLLNISEAMKTGGWVPTPLKASFWSAVAEAGAALAAQQQAEPSAPRQEQAEPDSGVIGLFARAEALHLKANMPWNDAEQLALSEAGVDDAVIDELIGECATGLITFLIEADDLRAFSRGLLVHGQRLLSSPAPAPLTDDAIASRNPYAHSANHRSVWAAGFRDAERAHKIGIVSGGGA